MELHFNKERATFDRFYEAHAGTVYGLIISIIADKRKAGKILKDTFVSIWTNSHRNTLTDDNILACMLVAALIQCSEALHQPYQPFVNTFISILSHGKRHHI